jgi:hypothetical protein
MNELQQQQHFGLQQQLLGMNALQQQGNGAQSQHLSMLQQMRNAGGGLGDGLQGEIGGQNLSIQQMLQLRNFQQQGGLDMGHQQVFGGPGMSGGMLGVGGNNEMLMQLLQQQQQQQQQIPQSFGGVQLGYGNLGSPDGMGSNQLALERELLLRQQQGIHQGMHGNEHILAGLQGAGGGHFGGGFQDSNNQLLLQLLQQQQQQQQQLQANIQLAAESVGSNPAGLRAANVTGNRGASHAGVSVPEGPKAIKKKTYKKRPKDKPKRPLSAYNFFFKEERARILGAAAAAAAAADDEDDDDKDEGTKDGEDSGKGDKVGKGDDEKGQRKGRSRPHGKISFEDLGRLISQRWQELNPEEVDYYKKKSDDDRKRYQEEMDDYRKKKAGN